MILSTLLTFFGLVHIPLEASQSTTTTVLTALKTRDADTLRQCFYWPIRLLLSNSRITKIWSKIDSTLGPVEEFSSPELHKDGILGTRTLKSLVRFQRGRHGVGIKFWGDKLVGVSFRAPITFGLVPEWEVPEYADERLFDEEEVSVRPYWLWPRVKGTLSVPKKKGRKPAVLMVPGSGIQDRDISIGAV